MKLNEQTTLSEALEFYPYLAAWFQEKGCDLHAHSQHSMVELTKMKDITWDVFRDEAFNFILEMKAFLGIQPEQPSIRSIDILPGKDKSGKREGFERLTLNIGDILTIVGPTGSGKSRLLADIEWMAQGDTPTGRTVLLNGAPPSMDFRFGGTPNIVAQLSQNMNFVMDLSVREFLELHASSRQLADSDTVIQRVLEESNHLAGEPFSPDMPITSLSGGQSRALMIADTAILSQSPIVLIDEIENAGIQRKKALDLLVGESKIVLMATHDPVLALMGNRRLVIKNGGIHQVLQTTSEEREILFQLEAMDKKIQKVRHQLRLAEPLSI